MGLPAKLNPWSFLGRSPISGHLTSYQDDSRAQVVKAYAVKAISQQSKKKNTKQSKS